jgi:hypothetical protein
VVLSPERRDTLTYRQYVVHVGSFRYVAVTSERTDWINAVPYGFTTIRDDDVLISISYILLGLSVMLLAYMRFQTRRLIARCFYVDHRIAVWMRPKNLVIGVGAIPVSVYCTHVYNDQLSGVSATFGANAYLDHFPMMLAPNGITGLCCSHAGPIAQFLVAHPQASREDVLDVIESTWNIRVSRSALYNFLKKYGLDRQSLDEATSEEPPHPVEDERALIEVLDEPPLSGLPLPCPPEDCVLAKPNTPARSC